MCKIALIAAAVLFTQRRIIFVKLKCVKYITQKVYYKLYNIKYLGRSKYSTILLKMQQFTNERDCNTKDEFWILEHDPVFTFGLNAKTEHLLSTSHSIPIIYSDRGGQITLHAPGQLIIYTLLDIKRLQLNTRELVMILEDSIIEYLAIYHQIHAISNRDAPGVYIDNKKIASLGLKIKRNYTYHGISFNINMDLQPFNFINVCGHKGLEVTNLINHITPNKQTYTINSIAHNLLPILITNLYSSSF